MSPARRVYLGPFALLAFMLAAGAVSLWWNDLTGVLLVLVGLGSTAVAFRRARRRSIEIQMAELDALDAHDRRAS